MKTKLPMKHHILLALCLSILPQRFFAASITANPPGPDYCYCAEVSLTFSSTPTPPEDKCCQGETQGTWSVTKTEYAWSGDIKGSPGNSAAAALDTESKKGAISAKCKVTYT
ncbi:MAG: hypothetical protein PHV34_25100, partial [Verrucomicrobiae bacterium]|nr:hypothetical protein [Verrucomicrobiae bacterium]